MAEDLNLYIGGVWAEGAGDAVHELISPPAAPAPKVLPPISTTS
jgi:hypothetical protein